MTLASNGTIVSPVWSQKCTKTVPTVYMSGEGGDREFNQRALAWQKLHKPESTQLLYMNNVPSISDEDDIWESHCEAIKKYFSNEIGLVVLDTVGRVLAGSNDNSQETVSLLAKRARLIQDQFDCVVIGIGHTGHDDPNRERGSSVFQADADTRIKISRPTPGPEKYFVMLEMFKQKSAPQWEEPKHFKLAEVMLDDGQQLAVTHADQSQIDRASRPRENNKGTINTNIAIKSAAIKTLESFDGQKVVSQRALCREIEKITNFGRTAIDSRLKAMRISDPELKKLYSDNIKMPGGRTSSGYKNANYDR